MKYSGTILVVDDDSTNVELLCLMVTMLGYNSEPAVGGEIALEKLKKQRYAAVLLDVMMPDINGIEVCSIIKSSPDLKDMPVVIVTAMLDDLTRKQCVAVGANVVMHKPVNFKKLRQVFELYIGNKHMVNMGMMEQDSTMS